MATASLVKLSNAGVESPTLPGMSPGGQIVPTGDAPPPPDTTAQSGVSPLLAGVIAAAAVYMLKKDVKYAAVAGAAGYVGLNYAQNKKII